MRDHYQLPFMNEFDIANQKHRDAFTSSLATMDAEVTTMDDVHRVVSVVGIRDSAYEAGAADIVEDIDTYLETVFASNRQAWEQAATMVRGDDMDVDESLEWQRERTYDGGKDILEDAGVPAELLRLQEAEQAVQQADTPAALHNALDTYAAAQRGTLRRSAQEAASDDAPDYLKELFAEGEEAYDDSGFSADEMVDWAMENRQQVDWEQQLEHLPAYARDCLYRRIGPIGRDGPYI